MEGMIPLTHASHNVTRVTLRRLAPTLHTTAIVDVLKLTYATLEQASLTCGHLHLVAHIQFR